MQNPRGKEARAQTQPKPTLLTLEAGKSQSSPSFPKLSVSRLAEISRTTAAAGSPGQAPHPPHRSPSPRTSPGSTRGCVSSPSLSAVPTKDLQIVQLLSCREQSSSDRPASPYFIDPLFPWFLPLLQSGCQPVDQRLSMHMARFAAGICQSGADASAGFCNGSPGCASSPFQQRASRHGPHGLNPGSNPRDPTGKRQQGGGWTR